MSLELVTQLMNRKLNVLIIDHNPTCLMILEKMLQCCKFHVTKCQCDKEALDMLQSNQYQFDIVIADVYTSDIDGFELLKRVGLEMDLPVIMMTSDDNEDIIAKGMMYGAMDFLIKPIQIENVKYLWKYVVRAQRSGLMKMMEESNMINNNTNESSSNVIGIEFSGSGGEDHSKGNSIIKKRKSNNESSNTTNNNMKGDALVNDDATTRKKQRVIWTPDLHDKFVAAVNHFGISKAVPKKILELMNVPGLTRENVASHLQKYRQYLKRLDQSSPEKTSHIANLMHSRQPCLQRISSIDDHQPNSRIASMDQQPNLKNALIEQQKQLIMQVNDDEMVHKTPFYHQPTHHGTTKMVTLDSHMSSYYGPMIEPNGSKMQMPTHTNVIGTEFTQGIASHVGDHLIYHPIAYTYLEGCHKNNEVGCVVNNRDMTSIDGQSYSNGSTSYGRIENNGHESAMESGYSDAPLYMEQFDQIDHIVARFDQKPGLG